MSVFFDTNILVYAAGTDGKALIARLLLQQGGTVSVQILNEFINVMRRKLKRDWADIEEAIADFLESATQIHAVEPPTQLKAFALAKRYDFRIYDAQIIASALEANCDTVWSEDMQDGMVIEGRLVVRNPFTAI